MAHRCVDWTVSPPTRKTPLVVLSYGDTHVYATVPEELEALGDVARTEFGLGDVKLEFYSSCVNLCSDAPARIGPPVWEHIRPFVGCISVVVNSISSEPEYGQGDSRGTKKDSVHARPSGVKENQRIECETDTHSLPERSSQPQDGDSEEEVSAVHPRRTPRRRYAVSDDDEEQEEGESETGINENEHNTDNEHERRCPQAPSPPPTSPPRLSQSPNRPLKKGPSFDDQPFGSQTTSSKQIKWEEQDSRTRLSAVSHEQSSQELYFRPPSQQQQDQWNENQRLVIRIAHRASKQESKFTTKSSTRVSKVVSGACKSFGLDAKQAALYLIVDIEDEDEMTENFFLCHMDDTMARAGAEHDTESRFLLTIAGDP